MSEWLDIHALADGELSAEEKAQAEQRLKTCDTSRKEFESVQALKGVLRSKLPTPSCDSTWTKCQGRLKEMEQKRRVERFVTRYAWGLCASIFVLMIGGAWMNRTDGSEVRTGELARIMAGVGPSSQPSTGDSEELQKWIPANRRKPPFLSFGSLQVIGATSGTYRGHPFAIFGINSSGQLMDLLLIDDVEKVQGLEPMVENSKYRSGVMGQRNCVSWKDMDYTLMLMGEQTPFDLAATAEQIDLRPNN
ncbi:MAG: hypothetical protein KF784_01425 [Fimbriimonadaceae bacterium]|nr:hypothetical protein [Fimbriimonadaceae bacterium]